MLTDANAMIMEEIHAATNYTHTHTRTYANTIQYGLHNFGDKQVNQLNTVHRINKDSLYHTNGRPRERVKDDST